jgi:hypothetical protein
MGETSTHRSGWAASSQLTRSRSCGPANEKHLGHWDMVGEVTREHLDETSFFGASEVNYGNLDELTSSENKPRRTTVRPTGIGTSAPALSGPR